MKKYILIETIVCSLVLLGTIQASWHFLLAPELKPQPQIQYVLPETPVWDSSQGVDGKFHF